MSWARRPLTSWAPLLRSRPTASTRAAYLRQAGRQARSRGYATGHDAPKQSDLPWLVGSVALTAPALYYIGIWKPDPNAHHDHEGHDDHAEAEDGAEDSEGSSASGDDAAEEKSDEGAESSDAAEGGEAGEEQSEQQNEEDLSTKDEGSKDTAKVDKTIDTQRKTK